VSKRGDEKEFEEYFATCGSSVCGLEKQRVHIENGDQKYKTKNDPRTQGFL
jgi:hypothetical protein